MYNNVQKVTRSLDEILEIVNLEISNIAYDRYVPQSLFDPITYILSLGGKRLRPALALLACNLYSDDVSAAIPVAIGVEVFHNFTLLHDDLMDRADMRRGKPTVQIKWNDNAAVLSGDAMLIEAYKEIVKVDGKYLASTLDDFSQTATEICCGQQLDMEFEKRMDVTVGEYLEMIRLKTAVLLGFALKQGALVAGANQTDANNLYDFGINLGIAFQLKDDLLDVYGNAANFGKKIGGDILCNKKTYLFITALTDKSTKDELIYWADKKDFVEEEKVKAVTEIYDRLGLKERSEELIQQYYQKALHKIEQVSANKERKSELFKLSEDLMRRVT